MVPGPADGGLARGGLLARNTLLNSAGQVVPLAIGAASIPFVLHALGAARFGLLSIGWVVLSSMGALDLGMGTAATKHVAEALALGSRRRARELAWASVLPQLALACAGGLGLWLASGWVCGSVLGVSGRLRLEAVLMLRVLSLGVPAVLVGGAFRGVLAAMQRFDLINAVAVPSRCAALALPALGAWMGWGLGGIAALLVTARYGGSAGYYALAALALPELRRRPTFSRVDVKALLAFGGWVAAAAVLSPGLLYLDRFIIGRIAGLAALALYAAPFEVLARVTALSGALAATLLPALSALAAGDNGFELARLYSTAVKFLMLIVAWLLPPALALLSWALPLWIGGHFGAAALPPSRLLLLGFGAAALAPAPGALLLALGRPDVLAKLFAVEIPMNAALVWWFTSHFGVLGGAASFALRAVFETGTLLWIAPRVSGGRVRGVWTTLRRPVLFSLPWLAVGVGVQLGFRGPGSALALGFGVLAFPVLSWRLALGPAERAGLWRWIRRVRVRVGIA